MNRIAVLAAATACVAAVLVARPAAAAVTPEDADLNRDGIVNQLDLAIVASGDPRGDLNDDGSVDVGDYELVLTQYGSAAMVPTPDATAPAIAAASGVRVSLALLGSVADAAYSLRADVSGATVDVRVLFQVDNAVAYRNENHSPYVLFGDSNGVPDLGKLSAGVHTIIARVYPQYGANVLATSEPMTIGAPVSLTPSATATAALPPTPTRTATPTATAATTPNASFTPTPTVAATTAAGTATPTATAARTSTPSATATRTPSPAVSATSTSLATPTSPPAAGTRDKFKQPFASTSIWNMPVGSGATYRAAPIVSRMNFFWTDEEPIVMGGNVLRYAWENGDWPISGRVGGRKLPYQVPVPSGLTTHSATDIGNQANFSGAFLRPDGRTIVEAQGLVVRDDAVTMMIERSSHDIYGDGQPAIGGHGGSSLSGVGGSIRVWEAQSDAPITHAIKTLISDLDLSATTGGYRWPARNADSGYQTKYIGSNSDLRMGALMAIPPSVDINNLGLTTDFGRRVSWTLQNYGTYVVDELYGTWDPITLTVELGVNDALNARYGSSLNGGPIAQDMKKLWAQLSIITNNGPGSVGGGGIPRQPLAPPIGN